jgi:hypothetical protein
MGRWPTATGVRKGEPESSARRKSMCIVGARGSTKRHVRRDHSAERHGGRAGEVARTEELRRRPGRQGPRLGGARQGVPPRRGLEHHRPWEKPSRQRAGAQEEMETPSRARAESSGEPEARVQELDGGQRPWTKCRADGQAARRRREHRSWAPSSRAPWERAWSERWSWTRSEQRPR